MCIRDRALPPQFTPVNQQPGLTYHGKFQHARALRRIGARRRAMRRIRRRHQPHHAIQFITRGSGNGQVPVVHWVEGAAVEELQHQEVRSEK